MNRMSKGFALIELLVVIAVIGIVIGLLLPAVQKVRETANRLRCQNNLKQIGLALHAYHDAFGRFPPGYTSGVAPDNSDLGSGWGWGAYLLPYVEQAPLHKQIDFNSDIASAANATPRARALNIFRCPSDSAPESFTASNTTATVAFANYVGMFGTPEIADDPGAGNGIFYRNSKNGFKDIRDGTSNTIAIGERHSYLALGTWTGAVTGAEVPPNHPSILGAEGAPVLCLGHTGDAAEGHTPNNPTNHVDDFGSFHVHGVNFLFADGSVRMIGDTINAVLWEALGTRSKGESISANDF